MIGDDLYYSDIIKQDLKFLKRRYGKELKFCLPSVKLKDNLKDYFIVATLSHRIGHSRIYRLMEFFKLMPKGILGKDNYLEYDSSIGMFIHIFEVTLWVINKHLSDLKVKTFGN